MLDQCLISLPLLHRVIATASSNVSLKWNHLAPYGVVLDVEFEGAGKSIGVVEFDSGLVEFVKAGDVEFVTAGGVSVTLEPDGVTVALVGPVSVVLSAVKAGSVEFVKTGGVSVALEPDDVTVALVETVSIVSSAVTVEFPSGSAVPSDGSVKTENAAVFLIPPSSFCLTPND